MDVKEMILRMHRDEFLTVGEIASALRQDPNYVYTVIFRL